MNQKVINVEQRSRCLLCGGRGSAVHSGLRDRLFGAPGEWNLYRCDDHRSCGLHWLNPMPLEEDISIAYEAYYTHEIAGDAASPEVGRTRRLLRRVHRMAMDVTSTTGARREALDMYLGGVRPGRVLEVGCGGGAQLLRLKEMGWDVEGQDVDPAVGARGLEDPDIRVHHGPLAKLRLAGDCYDAIVMNHVIEHVAEPVELLRECHRLLLPEGRLVLVTPNMRSFGYRLFGASWRPLEPPRHLFLFSEVSLRKLAKLAGFSKAEVRTSAASAEGVGIASWELLGGGAHRHGVVPWGPARLAGLSFQIAASVLIKLWPGSGEEIVLRARK